MCLLKCADVCVQFVCVFESNLYACLNALMCVHFMRAICFWMCMYRLVQVYDICAICLYEGKSYFK